MDQYSPELLPQDRFVVPELSLLIAQLPWKKIKDEQENL